MQKDVFDELKLILTFIFDIFRSIDEFYCPMIDFDYFMVISLIAKLLND